jgi:uncharacterized membrane protein YheB (UPF0754 family)
MMNKIAVTNLVALAITVGGYFLPAYSNIVLMTGLFALSGSVTNWLAIHMLFEKVPLLYGSGVIPNRFEELKSGIRQLLIREFFTRKHIKRFFKQNGVAAATAISDKIDFDRIFEGLTEVIQASPMGGMLVMIGGKEALQPIKEPAIEKLKEIIAELILTQLEDTDDSNFTSVLIHQVEQIIDNRLQELTAEKVKHIVQDMIQKHLGWLVVWGGIFGGIIGFGVSIAKYLN